MVPFLDLRATYLELKPEIDEAVSRVLDSGWYILGPEVEAFEAEWAAYCEAGHAVGLANAFDAVLVAVAHHSYSEVGCAGLRQTGRADYFFCDLKSVFAIGESDLRL